MSTSQKIAIRVLWAALALLIAWTSTLFVIKVASAADYSVTNPMDPTDRRIVRDRPGGGRTITDSYNPHYRRTITPRSDGSAVVRDPHNPHKRYIIRRR